MRVIDYFDRGATEYPDNICMAQDGETWTYAEVQVLTQRVSQALRNAGHGARARVAIYSPNNALAYACTLAIGRHNGIWVPINARNAIDENIYILGNNQAEVLIIHSKFADYVDQIRAEVPSIRTIVCVDKALGDDIPALADWMPADYEPAADPDVPSTDVFMHVSSGGTTGRPKGVMLSHRALEVMVATYHACMPVGENAVYLMVAPMTHAAGFMSFPMLSRGAKLVFMAEVDPERVMQLIESEGVTHTFLPPTVIYVMLSHANVRKYDYSSMVNFAYAAAPMSADKLKEAIEVFGHVMTQTYGQAEVPMICTYMSPDDHAEALAGNGQRLLSCGRATDFTRVEIMDDDGNLLPRGQEGEIVFRGDMRMTGYYNQPEETAEASEYGWHHTGDIGRIDEDGFVYIVDRKKDMIISGGFNVFPSEVEQVIWTHPSIQDCAVIGVPDEKWGEAVKAVVELKPDAALDEGELIQLCKDQLGSVKAPKTVDVWDELPRSPVGKVLKREIRKPFWADKERAIG